MRAARTPRMSAAVGTNLGVSIEAGGQLGPAHSTSALVPRMSAAVGTDLGVSTEAGGQLGLAHGTGQGSSFGEAFRANWLQTSNTIHPTESSSTTPGFRSAWQDKLGNLNEVSRGTNNLAKLGGETSTAPNLASTLANGSVSTSISTNGVREQVIQQQTTTTNAVLQNVSSSNDAQQVVVQSQALTNGRNLLLQPGPSATMETASALDSSNKKIESRDGSSQKRVGKQPPPSDRQAATQKTSASVLAQATAAASSGWTAPVPVIQQPAVQIRSATTAAGAAAGTASDSARSGSLAGLASGSDPASAISATVAGAGASQHAPAAHESMARTDQAALPSHPQGAASDAQSTGQIASGGASSGHAPASASSAHSDGNAATPSSARNQPDATAASTTASTSVSMAALNGAVPGKTGDAAAGKSAASGAAATQATGTDATRRPTETVAAHPSAHDATTGSVAAVSPHLAAVAHAEGNSLPAAAAAPLATPSTADHTHAAAPAAASPSETFAALDRGSSVGAPTWTQATGQHAEAGFHDPALGWVGVRADLSAGGVHATLVPSSTDAAQVLGSHVAGLTTHLSEQHSSVSSLSLSSPGTDSAGGGMGQAMQQGGGGHAQQGNFSQAQSASSQPAASRASSASTVSAAATGNALSALTSANGVSGTRISVLA